MLAQYMLKCFFVCVVHVHIMLYLHTTFQQRNRIVCSLAIETYLLHVAVIASLALVVVVRIEFFTKSSIQFCSVNTLLLFCVLSIVYSTRAHNEGTNLCVEFKCGMHERSHPFTILYTI